MIVTVTMNPALDKTAEVDTLITGGLNRLAHLRTDPGGKGINVGKMVAALGGPVVCTGFAAGHTGRELRLKLDTAGIPHDFLEVAGCTRTNVKIRDANNGLTELNEPGITVSPGELEALLQKVLVLAGQKGIVVLGGSLPAQADTAAYLRFTRTLRAAGHRVIVDADGEALARALEAPPHVIKPNRFELLQYYGLPDDTLESELAKRGAALLQKGMEWVMVSLGKQGALFLAPGKAVRARALAVPVQSTVGAGDCMVGAVAFALQTGLGFEDTVRLAMAASAGAVTTNGTNPPPLALVNQLKAQVRLEPIGNL